MIPDCRFLLRLSIEQSCHDLGFREDRREKVAFRFIRYEYLRISKEAESGSQIDDGRGSVAHRIVDISLQ